MQSIYVLSPGVVPSNFFKAYLCSFHFHLIFFVKQARCFNLYIYVCFSVCSITLQRSICSRTSANGTHDSHCVFSLKRLRHHLRRPCIQEFVFHHCHWLSISNMISSTEMERALSFRLRYQQLITHHL